MTFFNQLELQPYRFKKLSASFSWNVDVNKPCQYVTCLILGAFITKIKGLFMSGCLEFQSGYPKFLDFRPKKNRLALKCPGIWARKRNALISFALPQVWKVQAMEVKDSCGFAKNAGFSLDFHFCFGHNESRSSVVWYMRSCLKWG